jgi:predicted nucleic acid-binding protein
MPAAIDTSVLVEAEKRGDLEALLPKGEDAFYVPAHAAAEFLVGAHLANKASLQERARRLYDDHVRPMVDSFGEAER